MITKVTVRNFKNIAAQTYDFTDLDLLVGVNNSGKSTVLQALAIWQFCVQTFGLNGRNGAGVQVTLDNFTALPIPEFRLLWHRFAGQDANGGGAESDAIAPDVLIAIDVEWRDQQGQTHSFAVELRYDAPRSIYVRPAGGWEGFHEVRSLLPSVGYVPPFSALEPLEERRDDAVIRRQVGKAQPGSVLRNLLLRVVQNDRASGSGDWQEIQRVVRRWFSIELLGPEYNPDLDVYIQCRYLEAGREYDIISGGSGFHQALTLLAFLYGYRLTTILLDEPDAHLHVSLQREIIDYFKVQAAARQVQFIIATHAEEMIKGIDTKQIVSLLKGRPERVSSASNVLTAMADVSNIEVTLLKNSAAPVVLYLEGESDERILRGWAQSCGVQDIIEGLVYKVMGGGDKRKMKDEATRHFAAVRQFIPTTERLMLFDYDDESSYRPDENNIAIYEWQRRNIENYMLVPEVWLRFVRNEKDGAGASRELEKVITEFFASENLALPPRQSWRNTSANIFKVLNGKRLLFENEDSLFHRLHRADNVIYATRDRLAIAMRPAEIHQDVHSFFARLRQVIDKARTPNPLAPPR